MNYASKVKNIVDLKTKKTINSRKIAIVLSGAVTCTNKRFQNTTDVRCSKYVDYMACRNSTMKYIVDKNKNYLFDFYIHCWNEDLKKNLLEAYRPVSYLFENNEKYKDEFSKAIDLKSINFSQLSKALSQKKGIELVESSGKKYDQVMIYRPDVLLWKTMNFSLYSPNNIYFNAGVGGDFHFIMNLENAKSFKFLYDSAFNGNEPAMHHWVHKYVVDFMKKPVFFDNIMVRQHQDCVRRIWGIFNEGKISKRELDSLGIDIDDIKELIEEPT